MLRKTAVSLAVAGILSATQAHALSIGDIRVRSALNEPLDAEIHLTDTEGLKPLQIRPSMADIDEFALAGLSKSEFLSDIRFAIQLGKDGTGKLRMTSSLPVQEAFLNFLVEVNWPNGRLVREYTVLLDPPVFDPTPGQQAQPVLANGSVTGRESRRGRDGAAAQPDRIVVDARDTLWALAIKHRIDRTISSQQMMLALQKKNPNAFLNNNINQLKRGAVLRLPTPQEARALSTREAIAEIARQTAAWKAGRQVTAQPAAKKAAPVDVSKSATAPVKAPPKPPEASAKSDQLKIVSASKTEAKSDGSVSDQSHQNSDALDELTQRNTELEQQLAATLEDVDRIERSNADMSEKLDAIQQQLDALQRMLELKDQQLAMMQAELDDTRTQLQPPAPAEQSLMDKLSSPLYWGSALGALILAALGGAYAFWRRRKNEEQAAEQDQALEPAPAGLVSVPDELESAAEMDEAPSLDDDDGTDQISDEALDAMEDLDEMSDLDLDMDLDLAPDELDEDLLSVDQVDSSIPVADELSTEIKEEEFDLGIEDPLEGLDLDVDQPAVETADVQPDAEVDPDDLDLMLDSGALDLDDDDDLLAVDEDSASTAIDEESGVIDGLDIDELLTDADAAQDSRTDESTDIDDIDSLLDSVSDDAAPADAVADIDDIDALLDSASDEAAPADVVADIDDIDALLDSASDEAAPADAVDDIDDIDALLDSASDEAAPADAVADIDDIDALLDSVGDDAAPADAVADIDDIDALLDSAGEEAAPADAVADIDDIDALLDSVGDDAAPADAVADIDDIDALLESAGDDAAPADAVADIDDIDALLESASDETAPADAVADIDDIDALLDSASDETAPADAVADIDDIDALLESAGDETAAVDLPEGEVNLGDAELEALLTDTDGVEATDAATDPVADAELDALLDSIEADEIQPEADPVVAESTDSERSAADAQFDALLSEAREPASGDDLDSAIAAESEAASAAPLASEEPFDADSFIEDVPLDADADALLDQLMGEIDAVVEMPDAAQEADATVASSESVATRDAAEAEFDALMGLDDQLVAEQPEDHRSPVERAEDDMADLIASDLGDLDELLDDDPLADSSVAAADGRGLDDMLARMSAEAEPEDILDSEAGAMPTEAMLAEVELDSVDLNADLDDMLASLEQDIATEGGDDLASLEAGTVPENRGAELEAQIDSELDALLSGIDPDIELEEVNAIAEEPALDADMNLLEGADEVETKLDLARAYIEMEDLDGARNILNEVKQEGSDRQALEADRLLGEMPA